MYEAASTQSICILNHLTPRVCCYLNQNILVGKWALFVYFLSVFFFTLSNRLFCSLMLVFTHFFHGISSLILILILCFGFDCTVYSKASSSIYKWMHIWKMGRKQWPKRNRNAMELIKYWNKQKKAWAPNPIEMLAFKCMFARTSPSSFRFNIKPTHFDVIKVNRIDKSRFFRRFIHSPV